MEPAEPSLATRPRWVCRWPTATSRSADGGRPRPSPPVRQWPGTEVKAGSATRRLVPRVRVRAAVVAGTHRLVLSVVGWDVGHVQLGSGHALHGMIAPVAAGGGRRRGVTGRPLHRGQIGELEQVADPSPPQVVGGGGLDPQPSDHAPCRSPRPPIRSSGAGRRSPLGPGGRS